MPTKSATRITIIEQKLTQALKPTVLNVIDEGHLHQGHPGAQSGLGHFAITIASPAFAAKSIMECHRLVYAALGDLMQTDIHALRIKIIIP